MSISKLNLLTIKENCEEKTSGSQSFQRKSFLLLETIPFSGRYFVQFRLYVLREAVALSGSRSFQGKSLFYWKSSLLLENVPFSGSHSFWTLFVLVEGIHFNGSSSFYLNLFRLFGVNIFSGSRSLQWKPCYIVKAVHFSRSHPFQWKQFLLVEVIPFSGNFLRRSHFAYLKSSFLVEAIPFNRSCSCYWKRCRIIWSRSFQWKSYLLVEAAFFSGSRKQKPFL